MHSFRSLFTYAGIWRDLFTILSADYAEQGKSRYMHARGGSIKPTDAMIVAALLRKHRPETILEIGSFLGVSTRLLLDVSSPWQARVTAVDPNVPHRLFQQPRNCVEKMTSRHRERLEIVSAFFGTPPRHEVGSVPVIQEGWGRSFDVIFIDGDHCYQAVSDNFRLALKFLNRQGVIILHDALSWPDVTRFINEIGEEFAGRAEVALLGHGDRRLLKLVGQSNDGIGYFRLL